MNRFYLYQYLKKNYEKKKLFEVKQKYDGNEKNCHLSVIEGDLVAVVKHFDLSENRNIWLVDDGGLYYICLSYYKNFNRNTKFIIWSIKGRNIS
jgi:hypothetical protein